MSSKGDGNIQTFLRIRPSKIASGYFLQDDLNPECLNVNLPDGIAKDFVNNSKLKHNFQFNGVIGMNASQEDVFKKVGTLAVKNALDGFNSTIFAYGQTGSGKTFTLTGGPERYADRGIIPRAISMIFNEFRTNTSMQYKAYVSYLELYNEKGYDLLDPSHETKALEDLPKVTMLEDEHGNFHLKNLSMHPADNEEDALNLLFMGDTNRAIAETPMNLASSRSHCIFSIAIESRETGSDKVRRSKLHLVDLAGSERVNKTQSSGSILQEAKYINGSLFFLEMVIVALYEKSTKGRSHIPYRNSMMTSVLRDSLGGNCKTIMIATINPEQSHTEESLSTCRFAQRVSLIKNKAVINEDLDPSQMIRRLKAEILNLREEISFLKNEAGEGDVLTPQEVEELKEKCEVYFNDSDHRSLLNIGTLSLTKIKDAFAIMKNSYLKAVAEGSSSSGGGGKRRGEDGASQVTEHEADYISQVKDLKSCLLQRDNEIAILVNMVKKGKTADDVGTASRGGNRDIDNSSSNANANSNKSRNSGTSSGSSSSNSGSNSVGTGVAAIARKEENIIKTHLFGVPPPADRSIFDDAAASFEWFRVRCDLNAAMEENREILKDKITEAKSMGERANQSRGTITYLKNSIEAIRREKAIQKLNRERKYDIDDTTATATAIADGKESEESSSEEESQEEQTYRRAIEQEKVVYKESFERLRVLKPEIEHVRKILEKGRVGMQNQFDQWYSTLHARSDMMGMGGSNGNGHMSRNNSSIGRANGNKSTMSYSEGSTTNDSMSILSDYKDSSSSHMSGSSFKISSSNGHTDASSMLMSGSKGKESHATGDVSDDIMAFYQAKDELLKRRGR